MESKWGKLMQILILLKAIIFCLSDENCGNRRGVQVMINSENERDFSNLIEKFHVELGVVVERKPRLRRSAFIFTVEDCKQPMVLKLMDEIGIREYKTFDVTFRKAQQPTGRRGNNMVKIDDPEIVSKKYISYEDGNAYIQLMAMKINKSNSKVSVVVADEGQTYENRKIKSITISHSEKPDNPVIFIDAGIHAREWHARSMALYLLKKLADEATKDKSGILYQASFVIVPSVNPDGYTFSFNGNKMWRKSRKPVGKNCFGVDGNRNYDAMWHHGEEEKYPCSEVYRGPKPFSEEESIAIKNIMTRLNGKCKLYISIHTFGNSILFPLGYTHKKHPRYQELLSVGQAGVDAVRNLTGSVFETHESSNLYVAAGGSDDYGIEKGGIPFTFTLELGSEDFSFAVPESELKKTLEEGWAAIKAMVLKVLKM